MTLLMVYNGENMSRSLIGLHTFLCDLTMQLKMHVCSLTGFYIAQVGNLGTLAIVELQVPLGTETSRNDLDMWFHTLFIFHCHVLVRVTLPGMYTQMSK